jgi:hypothetical protein
MVLSFKVLELRNPPASVVEINKFETWFSHINFKHCANQYQQAQHMATLSIMGQTKSDLVCVYVCLLSKKKIYVCNEE